MKASQEPQLFLHTNSPINCLKKNIYLFQRLPKYSTEALIPCAFKLNETRFNYYFFKVMFEVLEFLTNEKYI